MPTLNYYLNAIGRCTTLYRTEALEGTGICAGDMPYLFHVCHHPGKTQDAIGAALYVNKTAVTRRITHLEELGLLTREPDPEDRRALRVFPTERAMALLPRLGEINAAWHDVLTEGFSAEEAEQLRTLLIRALQNARERIDGEGKE